MRKKAERVELTNAATIREIEEFCREAGIPRFASIPKTALAQFVIRDSKGEIAAAARLEMNVEHPFVEEVAVRADLRRTGLGKEVVEAVLEEAKDRRIGTIWAMARAPEFFRGIGFEQESERGLLEELLKTCRQCPDYLKTCNPALFKKRAGR